MADESNPIWMLRRDPRLTPPAALQEAIDEGWASARVGTRWNDEQTTELVLRAWARIIGDIGTYRVYGADDYMHHVTYRIRLDRILGALAELGHNDAHDWLQGEVDRLDAVFVERSVEDVEGLMLLEQKSDPRYWYLRRLPKDENVVEHLRIIQ